MERISQKENIGKPLVRTRVDFDDPDDRIAVGSEALDIGRHLLRIVDRPDRAYRMLSPSICARRKWQSVAHDTVCAARSHPGSIDSTLPAAPVTKWSKLGIRECWKLCSWPANMTRALARSNSGRRSAS